MEILAVNMGKTQMPSIASVTEGRSRLAIYLAQAVKEKRSIRMTRHGKPYALIHPISECDLEELEWERRGLNRLLQSWKDEDDSLYNYL